jgi:transposase InsO family protein
MRSSSSSPLSSRQPSPASGKRKSSSQDRSDMEGKPTSKKKQKSSLSSPSSSGKKKKYLYTEEQKRQLRQDHYKLLHEIDHFKRTSSFPNWVKSKSDRQNFKRKAKPFCIVADQLHKNSSTPNRPCRVLWENEIYPMLKELPENGAHYPKDQGKFRTLVEQRFSFPQISEITRHFILTCDTCQKEKASKASRTDREYNPPPPTDPYFRVHVDLCGPFRNRLNKERFVFICLDSVTKSASVKVIPNKKAATVARVIEDEILDRHGCPFEVVTDEGTEFNAEFSDLLKGAGLRHVRVRPKNPQANGQVERFMQILKSTLRATCHEHPSDWERFVQKTAFKYNVSFQQSIRTSPFVCLFGRQPILPADHVFPSALSEAVDQPTAESLESQASRLEAIRNVQRQSKLLIEQAQVKAKENFARWYIPRRPRSDSLSSGDYVIMQRPGNIRGFKLHWEGPYHFDGWVGEEPNRRAVLRDQKGQVW